MTQETHPGEDLLRVVGEQRGAHAPAEVAAAERELVERLGGTRAQARRRLAHGAVLNVVLGVLLVAAAVFIFLWQGLAFLHDDARMAGPGEATVFCITLGAMVLLGLAMAGLGLAVLKRPQWVLKRARFIPFARSAWAAAIAAVPPLEELLDTVGAGRAAQPSQRVAEAEEELRVRLARAHEEHIRRVRGWGSIAVAFGAYFVIGSSFVLWTMVRTALALPGAQGHAGAGSDGAYLLYFLTGCWVAVLNLCSGAGLLVCGLGLRRWRDRARGALIWIVWLWFAAGIAVAPPIVGWMLMTSAEAEDTVQILVFGPVNVAFLVLVLRSVTKPLASSATRDACRPSSPK